MLTRFFTVEEIDNPFYVKILDRHRKYIKKYSEGLMEISIGVKDAWLELAEAFGTPYKERTKEQKRLTKFGLWIAIGLFYADNTPIVSRRTMIKMDTILRRLKEDTMYACFVPERFIIKKRGKYLSPVFNDENFKEEHDDIRCLFCCFMAQIPEDEYKLLTK